MLFYRANDRIVRSVLTAFLRAFTAAADHTAVMDHPLALAAADDGVNTGVLPCGERELDLALFAVRDREVVVHGKTPIGLTLFFQIIAHVVHAAFFIGAKDQTNVVVQGDLLLFEKCEGVQRGDQGALVVHHAASDDIIALNGAAEGRVDIVIVHRDHIRVGGNHQPPAFGLRRQLCLHAAVVVIDNGQILFPAEIRAKIKCACAVGTVGISAGIELCDAGDLHELAQFSDDLLFVL